MVSGAPPAVITQNERFLGCDNIILGVRFGSFGMGNYFFSTER